MKDSAARAEPQTAMLGPYRLLAPLGQGGMAAVHLVVKRGHAGFNKLVVLKQILPQYARNPEMVSMFLDEARLAARFNHPNLVQTNEVGVADGTHFLAMEYLDGQPLHRILQRLSAHEGLPLALHLQVIADVLGGLHHAHELADYDGSSLRVVHGDVNPQNVFVTYDGVVKVFDFGVATARTALTKARPGVIKGKPTYMSPEQLAADRLDRRADIFAVGVMLWEAATGTRPWRDVSRSVMAERVLTGEFPAPCASNPAVSVELEAIILKALAFDRRNRYQTAAELQIALEAHLVTLGGRVPPRELGQIIAGHFAAERQVLASLVEEEIDGHDPMSGSLSRGSATLQSVTAVVCALSEISDPFGASTSRKERVGDSASGRIVLEPEGDSARQTVLQGAPAPVAAARSAERVDTTLGSPVFPPSPHRVLPAASDVLLPEASPPTDPLGPSDVSNSVGRTGRSRIWAAAGSMVAALVAIAALGSGSGDAAASATSAVPGRSQGAICEADAGAPEPSVELQLSASPREARMFLDDVPLEGNPYRGQVARDRATHVIRVEAAGCATRTESVTLDRDRLVDVVLAPESAPPQRAIGRASRSSQPDSPPRNVKISEW